MRAPLLALALLLALPALPVSAPAHDAVPLSHEAIAPYMHLAALDLAEGIRPGAWIQLGTADCTAAFVLRDATGALYLTTAGHCTTAPGQRASYTSDAAVAALATPEPFGTVVANWPQGLDAALIRIDADEYANVNPSMIGWGGPTGLVTSAPPDGTQTRHYGWGWWTWMDHTTRCRVGLLEPADFGGFDSATWWYFGPVGNGDSGSGVLTADGRALGILDWGGLGTPTSPAAFMEGGGTRLDRAIAAFEAVTGLDLELVTGGPVSDTCSTQLPV
jgi:hypothetical protein